MIRFARDLFGARELLTNLTMREVKGKYKRTVFGQLWSLANPIALMAIYTVVFGFLFQLPPQIGDPSGLNLYALWLVCGLLPWLFFANVVSGGAASLVGNANLIQKVYFPRAVLPIAHVGSVGFNWLFEMAVLSVALSIAGAFVLPWLPLVLIAMALLAVFAAGLALILAVANVYFRDVEHLLGIVLTLWMYLSPIIYPVSFVRDQSERIGGLLGTDITLLQLYQLNPMERFIDIFRSLLYDNRLPDPDAMIACAVWAIVSFTVGAIVFSRAEKKLAEAL